MGHRKHSQPRRGSLAYLPRCRANNMEARIRSWQTTYLDDTPKILGYCGFKVGCIRIVSIDDREKTPNSNKQLVDSGTVIVTPPIFVIGCRGYAKKNVNNTNILFNVFATELPKEIIKFIHIKTGNNLNIVEKVLHKIKKLFVIIAVIPSSIGLSQKKPYIFEVGINGNNIKKQFEYVKNIFGKQLKIEQVFNTGSYVDVGAITKGKGWEGPVTRWGVKRKQHKSRKSVREVGSLGPISPQSVMYTVPRAGQRGFHQRIEYNKRIMIISNTNNNKYKINPNGGFKHFGLIKGDYIVLRGSIPGSYRRLIKLRSQIRKASFKVKKPIISSVVV